MDLAAWMAETGQNDDQVAEKANVTRATISRVRRRKMQPSVDLAKILIGISDGKINYEGLFDGQVTPNDFYDLPELPDSTGGDAGCECRRVA